MLYILGIHLFSGNSVHIVEAKYSGLQYYLTAVCYTNSFLILIWLHMKDRYWNLLDWHVFNCLKYSYIPDISLSKRKLNCTSD